MAATSIRGPYKVPINQIIYEYIEVVSDFRTPRRELKLFLECLR